MIRRIEVKTYRERLICSKCDTEMEFEGIALMSNPAQYPFRCPMCQKTLRTTVIYPRIIHEEIEGEEFDI